MTSNNGVLFRIITFDLGKMTVMVRIQVNLNNNWTLGNYYKSLKKLFSQFIHCMKMDKTYWTYSM